MKTRGRSSSSPFQWRAYRPKLATLHRATKLSSKPQIFRLAMARYRCWDAELPASALSECEAGFCSIIDVPVCRPDAPMEDSGSWVLENGMPMCRRTNESAHQLANVPRQLPTRRRADVPTHQRANASTCQRVSAPTCRPPQCANASCANTANRANAPTCQHVNMLMHTNLLTHALTYPPACLPTPPCADTPACRRV